MSLSEAEISLIKETWEPVNGDKKNSGVVLFKLFFTKHPEYISLFAGFEGLDLEDLKNNKKLVSHALRVVNAISDIVGMLGDDSNKDIIVESLTKLARSHLKRKIDATNFRNLGAVLIEFLKQMNLNHSKEYALVEAWVKLYNVIVGIVEKESGNQLSENLSI